MRQILLFLLDGYADWESGYTAAKLNKVEFGFCVNTISLEKSTVISQGNFSTNIDYSLDNYSEFENLSAFILIGGTGWGNQKLIRGYNQAEYDINSSCKIKNFTQKCLDNKILVAGICDGATFLADNGFLDDIAHTGNSLSYLKEKAPFYTGDKFFKEKQSIIDGNIITANGTASLEFVRDILIKLNMLNSEKVVLDWFKLFKEGFYNE